MDAKEKARVFYAKLGFPVVPLTGKAPKGANTVGWQEWSFAETHQKMAKHTGNIGIRMDNLVVFDNDDPIRVAELFGGIEAPAPATAVCYHGNRNPLEILKFRERGHNYYAKPAWLTEAINYKEPDAQGKLQTVFEIRTGAGQQCVAPPSIHPDGTTYKWYKPELLANLPEFPRAWWEHVQKIVAEKEVEDKLEQVKQPAQKEQGWKKQVVEKLAGTWESFYQTQGVTGIKKCRRGQMLKGYTAGEHHHAPGFSFFPDSGYFVDFYSGQRGFPQDFLAGQNGNDKEKAWRELAQYAQVETTVACKYCEEKGEWTEIEGKWRLLVNGEVHNCRKPAPAGEKKETRKRLTSAEYLAWLTERGWNFSLCSLNDEVYTNQEEKLTDVALAQIQSYVLDRAIAEKRNCSWEHAQAAIVAHAAEHKFNPIADYFNHLKAWDGKDYLGELCKYIKAEAHFRRWLEIWTSRTYLKALALIDFNPALVLKGGQNLGKSYLAWQLCPEPLRAKFFFDGQFNFEDKDCLARQTEVLVWEHQEAGFAKRDVNLLKDFLSKKIIRWRSPWGKKDKQKPAISSFIFTINETGGCLVDEENRRFHVVSIREIAWEYSLVPGLMEGIWSQAKARAAEWATITKTDMEIRDGVNEQEKVCDPAEVILERAIEITGSDQDFLPLEEIIKRLAANEIKPSRATTMSVALFFAQLGLKKARGYISQDGRKIQVRGYRGCRM